MGYVNTRNVGLGTYISLNSKGGLYMYGGTDKVDDNMRMLIHFMGWFRIFTQDFVPNLYWLYQKDTSFISRYKNVARLMFLESAQKYAPFANVKAVDLPIDQTKRRELYVDIAYGYTLDKQETVKTIRFTRAL